MTQVQVQVRLSAELSRLVGRPRLSIDLAAGATVADVLQHVGDAYPALAPHLRVAIPFVRGSHAVPSHELEQGDELALLLPVAGGAGADDSVGAYYACGVTCGLPPHSIVDIGDATWR